MTQLESARKQIITPEMDYVAKREHLPPSFIRDEIAKGRLIITANPAHRKLQPTAIGREVCCKINANIGNSSLLSNLSGEIEKLNRCVKYGADAVMDLSTGGEINEIRGAILENSTIPLGTVPVYEALASSRDFLNLTEESILRVIKGQAEQGVDFMTIHCGLLREHLPLACKRLTRIVSRGGSIVARWMAYHERENPFYTRFDDILDICRSHDVSLSLGDGLRPGSQADASDAAQFAELDILGDLTLRAWDKGVQVMIEGPGHIPFNEIEMNMKRQESVCHGAPFYVLGPIVTDIAPGYDHITAAIGGTMAGFHGASMLCYVTPREHLGLPDAEDVRHGIIAFKIAAHAVDIAKKRPRCRERDDEMSKARYDFDWEKQFSLSLDPEKARELYLKNHGTEEDKNNKHKIEQYCTMCGPDFCAMKNSSLVDSPSVS